MTTLVCPGCGQQLHFAENNASRALRCPHCARVLGGLPMPTDAVPSSVVPTAPSEGTLGAEVGPLPPLTFLAPPQAADELGRLGSFRVLRVLGRGGMGLVFAAEDVLMRRRVALKVMLPDVAVQPQARERFLREARAAGNLSHDHIIAIFHVGEDNGVPFLVMPLLKGETLEARLRRERRLPLAEVVRIGVEMSEGLAAAHAEGLIHRDVKPANVWLEEPGDRVKLLDFGLARLGTAADKLTRTGGVLGTPAYMAPEQTGGEAESRSDVFSLGVVLYEMTAGERPFDGPNLFAILNRMSQEPTPLPQLRPEVPAELAALVRQTLGRTPQERPTAAEVATSLRTLPLPGSTSRAPSGTLPSGKVAPQWSRWRVLGALLTLVLLVALPLLWPKASPESRRQEEPPAKVDGAARDGDKEREEKRPRQERDRQKQEAYEQLIDEGRAAMNDRQFNAAERFFRAALGQKPGDAAAGKALAEAQAARATPEPEIENSIGLKLRLIPAGKFLMGSPETEKERSPDERPQREVQISRPFFLGIYPVTQQEYRHVVGENPSYFSASGNGKDAVAAMDTDRFPVERVSWHDAVAFCDKLSARLEEKAAGRVYRLPTEAEWEYACRAGTTTPFWWGSSASSDKANFDGNYPYGGAPKGNYLKRTLKVGSYEANPWGLFDMHGNVRQWCSDWYGKDYYKEEDNKDPKGPERGAARVTRGGSWVSEGRNCRAASRSNSEPGHRTIINIGFRVACSLSPRTP
jgi:formylglycine-generating enzyme required for sulfatase activity/serine/threonine protein kinase